MTSVRLTPAQERVLRAANVGKVYETYAPNRRGTVEALRQRGLLTLDVNEMGKRLRHFRPTDAGWLWLADHPEES